MKESANVIFENVFKIHSKNVEEFINDIDYIINNLTPTTAKYFIENWIYPSQFCGAFDKIDCDTNIYNELLNKGYLIKTTKEETEKWAKEYFKKDSFGVPSFKEFDEDKFYYLIIPKH